MATRSHPWLIVLALGASVAACGGSSSGATDTAAPDRTAAPDTTVAVTEPATTQPTTTLPPTLDLADLPGLLAVEAKSCAPEPYPETNEVQSSVICTLRPDGSEAKQVSLPGGSPRGPAWLRDGTHLFFGDTYSRFGFLIDLTTGAQRERVRNEPLRSGVSPDGAWVLFNDPDSGGISIANPDGSPLPNGSSFQVVSPDPSFYYEASPTWAPDSIRFAYLSTNDGAGGDLECPEVWVGGIDGRAAVQITRFDDEPDGAMGCPESVRWSPTGDTILMRMLGKPTFVAENLYRVEADGSGLAALTNGEPIFDPEASTYGVLGASYAADWSPDGAHIAFIMGDGTGYRLYVMNADGSQVTEVTGAPLGITTSLVSIRWAQG